jgi:hypothetical protein
MSDLIERIESLDFSIEFGCHSGYNPFFRYLADSKEFAEVLKLPVDLLFERCKGLINKPYDASYANPNDEAVATYLLALFNLDMPKAKELSPEVFDKNFWWSNELARRIIT